MKIILRCSLVFLSFAGMAFINPGHLAYAGIIPDTLIQSEKQTEKAQICESLKRQHAEILKKMAELKQEQDRYQVELKKLEKNDCAGINKGG